MQKQRLKIFSILIRKIAQAFELFYEEVRLDEKHLPEI